MPRAAAAVATAAADVATQGKDFANKGSITAADVAVLDASCDNRGTRVGDGAALAVVGDDGAIRGSARAGADVEELFGISTASSS